MTITVPAGSRAMPPNSTTSDIPAYAAVRLSWKPNRAWWLTPDENPVVSPPCLRELRCSPSAT
jgi:hypothetical protein